MNRNCFFCEQPPGSALKSYGTAAGHCCKGVGKPLGNTQSLLDRLYRKATGKYPKAIGQPLVDSHWALLKGQESRLELPKGFWIASGKFLKGVGKPQGNALITISQQERRQNCPAAIGKNVAISVRFILFKDAQRLFSVLFPTILFLAKLKLARQSP